MVRLLLPTCWWMCIMTFDFCLAQNITLHAFNQSDCITSCTHGLIRDMDYVVFKSEVDITDDPNSTTIFYQIKQQHDDRYKTICKIDISVECNDVNSNPMCRCKKDGNYLLYITIVYKAHYSNSGASIIGTVVRSKDHEPVRSNEQKFPLIYASNDTSVMVQINNENVDLTSERVEHIKEHHLGVIFTCLSPATPCLTKFSIDDYTDTFNVSGKQFYYKFYNVSKTLTLTIKSAACRLDGNVTVFNKNIQIDLESKPEKERSFDDRENIVLKIVILIAILLIILILIVFWCLKKKSLKKNVNKIVSSILKMDQQKTELIPDSEFLLEKPSTHSSIIFKDDEEIPLKNEAADLNTMDSLNSKHVNNSDTLEDDVSHEKCIGCKGGSYPSVNNDTSFQILSNVDIVPEMQKENVADGLDKKKLKRSISADSIFQKEQIKVSNTLHLKDSKSSIEFLNTETKTRLGSDRDLGWELRNRKCVPSSYFEKFEEKERIDTKFKPEYTKIIKILIKIIEEDSDKRKHLPEVFLDSHI